MGLICGGKDRKNYVRKAFLLLLAQCIDKKRWGVVYMTYGKEEEKEAQEKKDTNKDRQTPKWGENTNTAYAPWW